MQSYREIVFSVGRTIGAKSDFRGWGGKENKDLIGSPDSKGESGLCMFFFF